jgi:hypothetical protein
MTLDPSSIIINMINEVMMRWIFMYILHDIPIWCPPICKHVTNIIFEGPHETSFSQNIPSGSWAKLHYRSIMNYSKYFIKKKENGLF